MSDIEKKTDNKQNHLSHPIMRQIDDFFHQGPVRSMIDSIDSFFYQAAFTPSIPVDLYETDTHIVIKANLPGINREQITIDPLYDAIKISVLNDDLLEEEDETKNYYRKERRVQRMERVVPLPFTVEGDKTTASYKNGILTIKTPKQKYKKSTIQIDE
ncbi:Hsp20/alpha crystallin family protein [Bacillus solimangrovi]|uniref:SHSP domain-containing protein n=1 Tax=Bacillus solimangrovi TaxID=1305675 RepID=A0A1E5LF76_9BACI|nr:Hsp20/alpha crystallin family protein [Bacillus solimangrovi]OEH92727.1 hypothetical protein BFG57_01610 [Bacillus solimangrovi]